MEMRPAVRRKCPYGEHKSVYLIVERARMVRNGKPHISCVIALNNVTFRARVFDSQPSRRGRINTRLFDRVSSGNNDFASGFKRLHPRSLVCFDGSLCDLQRDSLRGDPRFDKIVASLAPKEAASK